MGKPTGFLEWERLLPSRRAVAERTQDYREIYLEQTPEQLRRQAGRCMDCGVPFCQQGCPLGNPIPDFNELVYRGRFEEAHRVLSSTNNFPEMTGRLCPAPCEAACTLTINQRPVTIEQVEKEIVERAFREGWVVPCSPEAATGKRIAVVGSGPAGLAAAQQLRRAGHEVTLLERDDRPGGLLRYGIPDFKLEKWVLDRRLEQMRQEGVVFRCSADVGGTEPWPALAGAHDAVVICTGARRPRDLEVPGRQLGGVVFAMDYLEQQNRLVAGDAPPPEAQRISAEGKHVIILGGGDTGSDCLGTAHRQGAASVTQIELFPAPPEERAEGNPWPQWPLVFRTSSSQEEGGERTFAFTTTRLTGEGGRLRALVGQEVSFEGGKLVPVPGSERTLPVDLLILAMGFVGPETDTLRAQLGLELDTRGNVRTDERFATSVPGVFAAGDARRGQSLIVWAIMEGREAARAVDAYLREAAPVLPTRGADLHFGGR